MRQHQSYDRIFFIKWIKMLLVCILAFVYYTGHEKEALASASIEFEASEHRGKYVSLGGSNWIVLDVIDGKAFLITQHMINRKPWNKSGDNSNISELFDYLRDPIRLSDLFFIPEDQDLVEETEWEIRSMDLSDPTQKYTTTDNGNKNISPLSYTQKVGMLAYEDFLGDLEYRCHIINESLYYDENYIDHYWTRTPYYGDSTQIIVYTKSLDNECFTTTVIPATDPAAGFHPVVYLKDSVRITGGAGTKENPYSVRMVTDKPDVGNIIEADGTEDSVTIYNVPASTTVKVYASNGAKIGEANGEGKVVVSVSRDLRFAEKVYVSFTQAGKAESEKIEVTVQDNVPPTIHISAPETPTNDKVTVRATVTDGGSDIAVIKWAEGAKDIGFFRGSGDWNVMLD